MRWIFVAVYLGIGALLHAMFIGSHFDWTSAWTFGWLLGWPIMLLIAGSAFVVALVALVVLIAMIWGGAEAIADCRRRRARA